MNWATPMGKNPANVIGAMLVGLGRTDLHSLGNEHGPEPASPNAAAGANRTYAVNRAPVSNAKLTR
jgi:hypothetical protein